MAVANGSRSINMEREGGRERGTLSASSPSLICRGRDGRRHAASAATVALLLLLWDRTEWVECRSLTL